MVTEAGEPWAGEWGAGGGLSPAGMAGVPWGPVVAEAPHVGWVRNLGLFFRPRRSWDSTPGTYPPRGLWAGTAKGDDYEEEVGGQDEPGGWHLPSAWGRPMPRAITSRCARWRCGTPQPATVPGAVGTDPSWGRV